LAETWSEEDTAYVLKTKELAKKLYNSVNGENKQLRGMSTPKASRGMRSVTSPLVDRDDGPPTMSQFRRLEHGMGALQDQVIDSETSVRENGE